jgi:Protein of unknown function (DUF3795)
MSIPISTRDPDTDVEGESLEEASGERTGAERQDGEQESAMPGYGDAYCGIYCGACSVLRHGETGRSDGFIACCGSVPQGELACGGCKSDALYPACRVCKLRDCAVAKGAAHCADCADYPCSMYRRWQLAAKVVPHVRESSANLEAIRRAGVDAWLAAQAKRWSCPQCGARFSWYAARCSECGRGLAAEAYVISGVRKLLCSLLLPLGYKRGKAKERNQ